MDAQNKLRQSTDAHRHSTKLWWLGAETLSVVPGKEIGRAPLTALGALGLYNGSLKNTDRYFCFSPFFIKVKILFGFLSVGKNRY